MGTVLRASGKKAGWPPGFNAQPERYLHSMVTALPPAPTSNSTFSHMHDNIIIQVHILCRSFIVSSTVQEFDIPTLHVRKMRHRDIKQIAQD